MARTAGQAIKTLQIRTLHNTMKREAITSAQNPKIKDLLALQDKSKERRRKGLFVVEGRREMLHCKEAG